MSATPLQTWTAADTVAVECCVCGTPGRPLYDVPPFGVVRCPHCSMVFVSPRLRPEALQEVYDDADYFDGRVYGRRPWAPASVLQRTWTAGRLATVREAVGREPSGLRLLEVGAGFGHFLAAARDDGYAVTGVELSATASRHASEELGLDVRTAQLAEAGLDGPFDVVCAWDTIEHVPDPVAFLRSVRGLLADDGVLAFSTPYISSVPGRLLGRRWWTLKPVEHIWHFTPETHATALTTAGLALVDVVRSPLSRSNLGRVDSLVGVARPLPGGAP